MLCAAMTSRSWSITHQVAATVSTPTAQATQANAVGSLGNEGARHRWSRAPSSAAIPLTRAPDRALHAGLEVWNLRRVGAPGGGQILGRELVERAVLLQGLDDLVEGFAVLGALRIERAVGLAGGELAGDFEEPVRGAGLGQHDRGVGHGDVDLPGLQ